MVPVCFLGLGWRLGRWPESGGGRCGAEPGSWLRYECGTLHIRVCTALHWLVDSPDPVHSGDPKARAAASAQAHKTRHKGAGLGLPFAVALVESTGVPVGLVACAHGGTSMEQWNPAKKEQGGKSLYGSMLRQVKLAGGKVKGVLWYQGESDAIGRRPRRPIPRSSPTSSRRSAPTSGSPSCRFTTSRSAGS